MKRRKAQFRAALVYAGLSQTEWARREGITQGHLSQVLTGKRESPPLLAKIEAFIGRYAERVAA